jgi:hypothetical protein
MIDEKSEAFRRLGYHPTLSERQMQIYNANRELFLSVYNYIDNLGPATREKSLALTTLQEALMWLNAHVACNGIGSEDASL